MTGNKDLLDAGIVIVALGLGLIVSTGLAWLLARTWGLLPRRGRARRTVTPWPSTRRRSWPSTSGRRRACARISGASPATPHSPTTSCRRPSSASCGPAGPAPRRARPRPSSTGRPRTSSTTIGGGNGASEGAGRARAPAAAAAPVAPESDLGRIFARLAPRDRALLWLAHVEGHSHAEIGAALGLKAISVRVMLFRARAELARRLRRADLHPRSVSMRHADTDADDPVAAFMRELAAEPAPTRRPCRIRRLILRRARLRERLEAEKRAADRVARPILVGRAAGAVPRRRRARAASRRAPAPP